MTALEHNIKHELKYLLASFAIVSIIFYIAFRTSGITQVLRTTASIYWLFVIPGYALALYSSVAMMDRVLTGTAVQIAIYATLSYYIGLAGLTNLTAHVIIVPIISIVLGIVLWKKYSN